METKIIIDKQTKKESCGICLEDDIEERDMVYNRNCPHEFCSKCVKQHIEQRLLQGNLITCPHDGCNSLFTYRDCELLLSPKVKDIWKQRILEDWIPLANRLYCPNPKCSALMSTVENVSIEDGFKRDCVKCCKPFCTNCKVPWHDFLSCEKYKSLHPNQTVNDGKLKALALKKKWRQCGKCHNMVELSQGCINIRCRCGNTFCYRCGAVDGSCSHGHGFPMPPPWFFWLCGFVIALVITAITLVTLHFKGRL